MAMRIVAFGDIHETIAHIGQIKGIHDASCIIITGDLTNRGGIEQAKAIIEYVRQYNSHVYGQAGNFDRREVEDYLIEQGISLHGRAYILEDKVSLKDKSISKSKGLSEDIGLSNNKGLSENIGIFGVGGSNITPFNTPNEFHEKEIQSIILQGYQKIENIGLKLFISHAPPFNTKVDIAGSGQHVGSRAVREFIEKYQPDVCVTGHIHEAKGMDRLGRTVIVNPGMFKNRGYVEIIKEEGVLKATLKQVPER